MNKILIVGLGNPGDYYKLTKHNIGFRVIDELAKKFQFVLDKRIFNGVYTKKNLFFKEVFLLKPETFMNLSGKCVLAFANYFKINLTNIYIVYDDLDLLIGTFKFKLSGSSGGQKGMQNIIDFLKTEQIKRYKIGIGIENRKTDAANYVLARFSTSQELIIAKIIDEVVMKINEMLQS